ncbi:MAG: NUDIX hydrolase [Gammaproteobacteria bacterium]|nr:NUDIX hydrolase [Gammaproteobacteria bacterium]
MSENNIIKIGAIIFNELGELMAVHKKGKPEHELIVPGGRMEKGENDEQTLRRELYEELNATVQFFEFYGQFEDKAIYENKWLIMRTYMVSLHNPPQPSNEIDQIVWLNHNYKNSGYQFASILGKQLLPRLFSQAIKN